MTRQPAPQQHKLKHFEEAVLPCWLCPVKQGRASHIDCAVTERYRAVNFRPEFAVLVEFCAADKFHYTRAADTVNTVRIFSLFNFFVEKINDISAEKIDDISTEKVDDISAVKIVDTSFAKFDNFFERIFLVCM